MHLLPQQALSETVTYTHPFPKITPEQACAVWDPVTELPSAGVCQGLMTQAPGPTFLHMDADVFLNLALWPLGAELIAPTNFEMLSSSGEVCLTCQF